MDASNNPTKLGDGSADREPAARCVGWREHMACIVHRVKT